MMFFEKKEATVKKEKVKIKKITAKDLQAHIYWLDQEMIKVQAERNRLREIREELANMKPDTEEDDQRYSELLNEAKLYEDADAKYTLLQEQKEKEYTILKKYKDSKFYIPPKDLAIIAGVSAIAVFMISLERENPKSLKLASFVLKLFPIKI